MPITSAPDTSTSHLRSSAARRPRSPGRHLAAWVGLVAATAWGAAASAQTTVTGAGAAEVEEHELTLGVGVKTGMSIHAISPPDVSRGLNPPLPAFLGNGGGVGLAVEALYADVVGLQLELWRAAGSGEGTFTFIGASDEVSVGQRLETVELQLPILIKGQLPLRWFKPQLGLGVTVVWQLEASYSIDNPDVTTDILDPPTSTYTMLTAQLGGAIDLGAFRIPIELRALYHPLERDPNERTLYSYYEDDGRLILSSYSVNATWEAQFWMMVGVQYWNEVDL